MRVVGLTGGIATGKSTVSETVEKDGIDIVDCDKIAHAVVKKGRWGYERVVSAFGPEVLQENGELDRSALGQIIFNDAIARNKLNRATHLPVFLDMFSQLFWLWLWCRPIVVVDMPLLFETGSNRWFGVTVLVACSSATQVQRLLLRDGCSQREAEAKVAAQMSLEEKRKRATYVIENEGSRTETASEARRLMSTLKREASFSAILLSPISLFTAFAVLGSVLVSLLKR